MEKINLELRKKLKPKVREFTIYLKNENNGRIPTSEYYIPSKDQIEKEEIPDFINIHESYKNKKSEYFRDVANWFISSGSSYEKNIIFKEIQSESSNKYQSIAAEDAEIEQIISSYEDDFMGFTSQVLDYSGSYDFNTDDYDAAFEDFFGVQYGLENPEKHIAPISSLEIVDCIKLPIEDEWLSNRGEKIAKIEIDTPTIKEIAAIKSAKDGFSSVDATGKYKVHWNNIIRIEMEDSIHAMEVIKTVITALRLYSPEFEEVHVGNSYNISYQGKNYREGIEDCIGINYVQRSQLPILSNNWHKIESINKFEAFWNDYSSHFPNMLQVNNENELSGPLRRFNQSYNKKNPEDSIVDIVIGFESTLLKDIPKNSSYSFRLGLRSNLLLNDRIPHSTETIRRLFKNMYFSRGEVVHQNRQLSEIEKGDGFYDLSDSLETTDYLSEYRYIFANTLIEYMEKKSNLSMNITEINQALDDIIWDTSSPDFEVLSGSE